MLFGGSQYENSMSWRFFECFQECIKRRRRQHVNLVDDVDAVLPYLWRYPDLIGQIPDIVNRIVRSGIEFMNVV